MRIRVVDAFAERAFSGNPAAVCVLAAGEWPEAAVRELAPDVAGLEVVNRRDHNRGTIVTAPAQDFDFVSRFFAPAAGIAEDPVCGSAHTAPASYWAERLGRDELVGYQASARGGVLHVTAAGDRVHLSGNAVTTLDGELLV